MKRLLIALALACPAPASAERLTQVCNPNYGTGDVWLSVTPQTGLAQLLAMATDPAGYPQLFERLWSPRSARIVEFITNPDYLVLSYDPVQDTGEIAAALAADSVLQVLGVDGAFPDTATICFSAMPPPARVTITEYHNAYLDHYFLSSTEAENAFIDSGGAGPGWSRTGETFRTIQAGACYDSRPVFRFYTRGANSHFFTVDTVECGFLRRNDPGWIHEGEAFGARMPVAGACAAGTTPLYRFYNHRWMFNDSNHRFVARAELRDQMKARGWGEEGVAMCLFD